jgi:hypothetical protein
VVPIPAPLDAEIDWDKVDAASCQWEDELNLAFNAVWCETVEGFPRYCHQDAGLREFYHETRSRQVRSAAASYSMQM